MAVLTRSSRCLVAIEAQDPVENRVPAGREDDPLTLRLIDTHAHLDDPQFDADRLNVIDRATAAGVDRIVIIGYRPSGWERAITTARSFPGGRVCLGVHPAHADDFDQATIAHLRSTISDAGDVVVGIGETGVDLFRSGPTLEQQRTAFTAQLTLAAELSLPTVIHQRAAETECLDILRTTPTGQAIVLHSFDAGAETAAIARQRGWCLGVGGLMTRASSVVVRDLLRDFPIDRLVLETDSPYLVPNGVKARRNEPGNVLTIARRLADLRGISLEVIAEKSTANAERVFAGI